MFEASSDDYYPTCAIPFLPFSKYRKVGFFRPWLPLKTQRRKERRPYKSFSLRTGAAKGKVLLFISR
ncbi:hypothetical protein TNCV_4480451 [Trichonephila clavipes]|nr:hypothetical protein TNCV_4480451 [Trichonephila clavipes]